MYVAQLREVFDSCSDGKHDDLNREELQELCRKLQLGDQTDALVNLLLDNNPSGICDGPYVAFSYI